MSAASRRGIVLSVTHRTLDPDIAVQHLDRLYTAARPWQALPGSPRTWR
jgi:hypothetical protein